MSLNIAKRFWCSHEVSICQHDMSICQHSSQNKSDILTKYNWVLCQNIAFILETLVAQSRSFLSTSKKIIAASVLLHQQCRSEQLIKRKIKIESLRGKEKSEFQEKTLRLLSVNQRGWPFFHVWTSGEEEALAAGHRVCAKGFRAIIQKPPRPGPPRPRPVWAADVTNMFRDKHQPKLSPMARHIPAFYGLREKTNDNGKLKMCSI